ncbi:MAG: YeeE/YedE family protein [Fibrobacterales bacterium]
MKSLAFIAVGILFGMVMTQAEIISWFRIQEMFRFQAFHMYGVIGSAVALGIVMNALIKKFGVKSVDGSEIVPPTKNGTIIRNIIGGTLFGIGWAFTGACPGPLFVLLGNGLPLFGVVIMSAILGAFTYGCFSKKLPK